MKYVLAIDEGTTGATCLMIGEDGRVAGRGYREIPQYFPAAGLGRARRDGDSRLRPSSRRATRSTQSGRDARRRSASPISARRSSSGSARRAGRCIARSSGRIAAPPRAARSSRRAPRGSPSAPASSSIRTSRRRRSSGCFASSACSSAIAPSELAVGTIDSWLVWQLTGGAVHATDPTNASRTMLYDIDRARVERRAVRAVRRAEGDAARSAPVEWRLRRVARAMHSASRFRFSESPAISRPRCSARDAGRAERARTRTARARFCC